jgi:hypothetical protein
LYLIINLQGVFVALGPDKIDTLMIFSLRKRFPLYKSLGFAGLLQSIPEPSMIGVGRWEGGMLDAGGDPVERDTERRPLRPVYRRPAPERPTSRPVSVWVIALVLVALGLLAGYVGVAVLADAADEPGEDPVTVVFGLGAVAVAAQVVMGVGLFAGARWARTGALALCALTLVLAIAGALTERMAGGQLWLNLALNLTLIFALLGPKVYAWTGG